MGEKTDNPHDTRMTELFNNKEAFISFIKDCVKADWADDIDEDSLRRSPKSYVLPDFKKKHADVVYEGELKKNRRKVIFFILLENQSRVDYRMNYRLLLYIVEILRDYYNSADVNERKRKNFKFPAVFPIVFYTGSGKWTTPLNLKEMFDGYENFGDYLLNFNYALVEAKGYDDESVKDFRSKLLKLMMLFERSREFIEVLETAKKYKDDVASLNDEEKRIFGVALDILSEIHGGQGYNFNEILREKNTGRVDTMLAEVIANAKNYERNLVRKGRVEGRAEGEKAKAVEIAKSLLDVLDVETISKKTKLTLKEVEALKFKND